MPGSTRIGTAPTLNRAKVRAKNSRAGGTISTVRIPRPMPKSFQGMGDAVALFFELGKGGVAVGKLTAQALRNVDGGGVGLAARHLRQMRGDVGQAQRTHAGRGSSGWWARKSWISGITSSAASSRM